MQSAIAVREVVMDGGGVLRPALRRLSALDAKLL
jgi:hypothetical protein